VNWAVKICDEETGGWSEGKAVRYSAAVNELDVRLDAQQEGEAMLQVPVNEMVRLVA
jgi:hypothetical protein